MAPFKDIVPRPLKGNIISAGKFPLGMDKSKAVDLLSSHDNCIFREFEPDLTLSDIVTEVTADWLAWFPPQAGGGSSEQVVGGWSGNPDWGVLPFVGKAALVLVQVPYNATCQTAANAPTSNLSPIDHLAQGRYAVYKGITLPVKTDENIAKQVGLSWVENIRRATLGNMRLVDKNGKLGVDVFQGEEWVSPHDTIRCQGHGSYNDFVGYFGTDGFWTYYRNKIINDSRFDDYTVVLGHTLGAWNVGGHGAFTRFGLQPWQVLTKVDVGPTVGDRPNPGMSCGYLNLSPQSSTFNIGCWDTITNIWSLKEIYATNYSGGVHMHEVGHSIAPPTGAPNANAHAYGLHHGYYIGASHLDSLPCVFTDTGPKGVHCNIETEDTGPGGQMNVMDRMSGGTLYCTKTLVDCSIGPDGYKDKRDYWTNLIGDPGYWAWTGLLDSINVVDLTPIDQTTPGVIFEDWLTAGDIFFTQPDLQSLGSRKVVITQDMHTDLPYPADWDNAVDQNGLPSPKKRTMHLFYYARGEVIRAAFPSTDSGSAAIPDDGQVYLSWGPSRGAEAGFNNMTTFERMDVDSANPTLPLIINGFNTTAVGETATRFNGWKVEIIGYGPGAPSRKSKVKLRITSLGDTGA